jgi:hypothetical protein
VSERAGATYYIIHCFEVVPLSPITGQTIPKSADGSNTVYFHSIYLLSEQTARGFARIPLPDSIRALRTWIIAIKLFIIVTMISFHARKQRKRSQVYQMYDKNANGATGVCDPSFSLPDWLSLMLTLQQRHTGRKKSNRYISWHHATEGPVLSHRKKHPVEHRVWYCTQRSTVDRRQII